jgi:hypothetical protein
VNYEVTHHLFLKNLLIYLYKKEKEKIKHKKNPQKTAKHWQIIIFKLKKYGGFF